MTEYNAPMCELYRHKVDDHDDDIKTLTVCVEKLTLLQEDQTKRTDNIDTRLTQIEKHPSKLFDKIVTAIISACVSAIVSAIFAFIIGGIAK